MDRLITISGMIVGGAFVLYAAMAVLFSEGFALLIIRTLALIGLGLGFAAILGGAYDFAVGTWKARAHASRIREAEARRAHHEADVIIRGGAGAGYLVHRRDGLLRFFAPPPNGKLTQGVGADPDVETLPDLLPVLLQADRTLLVGGMGAGKSELLRWIAAERLREGHVIIIDTHGIPGDWPPYCQVAGMGRRYAEAEGAVRAVIKEMDRRYRIMAAGIRAPHHPMTLIIDEMTVLNQFTNLGDEFKSLLCECRKANIKLYVAGQSDRAGSLGIKGNADLIAGFEIICHLVKESDGRRIGLVKTPNDKDGRRHIHPGPYKDPTGPGRWGSETGGPGPTSGPGLHAGKDDDEIINIDPAPPAPPGEPDPKPSPKKIIAGLLDYFRRPQGLTEKRAEIWEALARSREPMSARDLESMTGMKGSYIRKTLTRLNSDGLVTKEGRGRYRIVSNVTG